MIYFWWFLQQKFLPMAATVRLASRLDASLLNLMVHELAEVEGMASSCESTAGGLSDLLFTHAPFQGPTVFMLEVDEPAKKEQKSKDEEAMSGTVVTRPIPEISPLLEEESPEGDVLGATASVELMLFRSVSNVKYKGRFFSEVSSPKSSGNHLQTTDMEEPVLEVFRSGSDVNLKERGATVAMLEDVRPEVVGELRCLVEDPLIETFRSPCKASRIVVGYLHVFPNFSTYLAKPGLFMEALYIRKPYRHLGLGKMFLKKIAREAVKLGMERMEWRVLYSNDPAIKFYEGLGAIIEPEFRKCAINGQAFANCEP